MSKLKRLFVGLLQEFSRCNSILIISLLEVSAFKTALHHIFPKFLFLNTEKLHFLYNNFIAYKAIIELRTSQLCFGCTQVHCHACIKSSRMYDQLMF